jgi:hypothetical protein
MERKEERKIKKRAEKKWKQKGKEMKWTAKKGE